MAANGVIDAAGNNYGGTGVGSAGVGDVVSDVNSIQGTVTKVLPGPSQNLHKVMVVFNTTGSQFHSHAPGFYEQMYYARQLTIISHADGTGLVSGGAAQTQTGDGVPTEYNYAM